MKETTKAFKRRWSEDTKGLFFWREIFNGVGIDIGCGGDPAPLESCIPFDKVHGDANKIHEYFEPESFDYIHASNVLEHMIDPLEALKSWLRILKPGGHIVFTVPDMVLYEGMQWPSRYNPDHKSSWSLIYHRGIAPQHIYVPLLLHNLGGLTTVKLGRLVDTNYDYKVWATQDQTLRADDNVECFIEVVLQKRKL